MPNEKTYIESIQLYTLNERVCELINGINRNRSPESYLNACKQLRFWSHFPVQWHRCRKLVKLAYDGYKNDKNATFEIYYTLYDFALDFFVKSNKPDTEIALFSFNKMKETKKGFGHAKVIMECWYELMKFGMNPGLFVSRK